MDLCTTVRDFVMELKTFCKYLQQDIQMLEDSLRGGFHLCFVITVVNTIFSS